MDKVTYRELLGQLKLIETISPEILDNPVCIESYKWDSGETRYIRVEEMEVIADSKSENSRIVLRHRDY